MPRRTIVARSAILIVGLAACLAFCDLSAASTLSLSYSGRGSGSIGGADFTDRAFVFSATVDSSLWAPLPDRPGNYAAPHSEATVSIEGLGVHNLSSETHALVSQSLGSIGFLGRETGPFMALVDLYRGPVDPGSLQAWDMASPLPPMVGTGELVQWDQVSIATTGGQLFFETSSSVAAAVVSVVSAPEPGGVLLLAAALAPLSVASRRSKPTARSRPRPRG